MTGIYELTLRENCINIKFIRKGSNNSEIIRIFAAATTN